MRNLRPVHFRVPKSSQFRLTPCGIGIHDFETIGVNDDQVLNHIKVFFNKLCNVIDVTIFSDVPCESSQFLGRQSGPRKPHF